ncbi:MAG: NUDIX hydrolase [Acetobacteraceae bacterium]
MNDGREYPPRPLVGIGIVVLKPDAVLLVRRGHPPNQGQWSLPGGAQELGESAEEAARRELAEETGLSVGVLQLVGHFDSIHRDSLGRVRFHYTILDFGARYERGTASRGSDVEEAVWAAFDLLQPFKLPAQTVAMIGRARVLLD